MIHFDFSGKAVLVTGSSRGIGAAILEHFAKAKALCLVNYLADPEGQNLKDAQETAARLTSAGAAAVHLFESDVSKFDSVAAMMQRIQAVAGGLDVLVCNAGILRDRTIRKMTSDDWNAVISTNLTGVFNCCKLGSEILRDGGRIVNIASIAGIVGFPGQANYSAAKAGVIAMSRVLAKELARRKITVNAIAPGVINTPILAGVKPEVVDSYIQQIPMGRLGEPADVANAVLFLASEESSYITGQVLPVTGGWH
jgi:3-oxoacyl-[acyl-carrier protein] reductase